ncbi:hypothetical protein ACHWQZ_G013761 [Mnemiopsis leidyi]
MTLIPKFNFTSIDTDNNTDLHSTFSLSLVTWHFITLYYTLKVLLGLLGNSLVLHAFRYPDLLDYKKISIVILTNLAVADILILLIQGVPTIGVLAADRWPFGSTLCHLLGLTKYTTFYIEVFLTAMLSAHRAYILTFPFKGMLITKRSAVRTIVVIWIASILLNAVGVIGSEITFFDGRFLSCNAGIYLKKELEWEGYLLGTSLLIGSIIIYTSLFIIGWKAKRATVKPAKNRNNMDAPPAVPRKQRLENFVQKNKSTITVCSVVGIFCVSIVPVFIVHLLKYLGVNVSPNLGLTQEVIALFGVVLNPVIYSLTNPTFLKFYKEQFRV